MRKATARAAAPPASGHLRSPDPEPSVNSHVVRAEGAAVLVPLKAFRQAKLRLAEELSPDARSALVRRLAARVIESASPMGVWVVCDDEEVAAWAERQGAEVIWRPGRGLNGAVSSGFLHLGGLGYEEVIVSHGDLPRAAGFGHLAGFDGVTAVGDRSENGTNVLCLPSYAREFQFSYGPASFSKHCAEARRLGLNLKVVRDPDLAWDVDTCADLAELRKLGLELGFDQD